MSEQNAIQVSKKPELRAIMRSDQIVGRFEEITGKGQAGGYISSVLIAVSQNQELMKCEPNSIIASALRAATMELSVDPSIGQAYLVPFAGKATLIVGYKGLYQMAIRTGRYKYLNLVPIYEGDNFTEDRATGNMILRQGSVAVIPERRSRHDQTPAGYLLYMELKSGFIKTFFMTNEECDDHGRKFSKTYNFAGGLWKKDPHAMYRKTVIRMGITKWGYLDPHDIANLSMFEESEEETPDYIKGIEIKEIHQSVEQNIAELMGENYTQDTDEPETEEEQPQSGAMTFEQAFNIESSNGAKYGNFTNKELEGHQIGINKKFKSNVNLSQQEQDELINKLEAIKILLSVPEGERLQKQGQPVLI